MSAPLPPWLLLAGALAVLLASQQLLTQSALRLLYRLTHHLPLAMLIYAVVIWPGTVLHEVAHWLVARGLGVSASAPHLLPGRLEEDGRMVLGHVQIAATDPLRRALIGVAPLLAGTLVVALLARYAFSLPIPAVEEVPGYAATSATQLLYALPVLFGAPNAWLFLYLLLAVANAMPPSEADRESWPGVLLFLSLLILAAYLLIGVPDLPDALSLQGRRAVAWLTFALWIAAVANILLLLVVFPLERLFWRLGR